MWAICGEERSDPRRQRKAKQLFAVPARKELEKIYKIGNHGQVLAISHIPQVIAISDYQYFIEKQSSKATTVSTVRLLNQEERIEEIAKMLAGDNVTQAARQQAKELLKK